MKRIPKQFEVFCALWDVEQPKYVTDENDNGLLGMASYDDTTIQVARRTDKIVSLSNRDRWETFWHEVVHVIDYTLHHEESEQWGHSEVDRVGRLLAQITWSMR